MTYQEYQALNSEEKMIARFRSLENVALASKVELLTENDSLTIDNPETQNVMEGTVESVSETGQVTVKIDRGFHRPFFAKMKKRYNKAEFGDTRAPEATVRRLDVGDKVSVTETGPTNKEA